MDNTKSSVSRRGLFRYGALTVMSAAAAPLIHLGHASAQSNSCFPDAPTTPSDALSALMAGNERWSTNSQTHPREDPTIRTCLAGGQSPWAAILSCSDSRVPPELVFDTGLGDLFVARVAGNTASGRLIDSLLFGTSALAAQLLFVMGHSACGAVVAAFNACNNKENVCKPNAKLPFVDLIFPAVRQAKRQARSQGQDPTDPTVVVPLAIQINVQLTCIHLRAQFGAVNNPNLLVAGGVYDLATQVVTKVA